MMAISDQVLTVRETEKPDGTDAPAPAANSHSAEVAAVEPQSEDGLARAVVVGGILGFLVVFVLVAAAMRFAAHHDLVISAACGAFVGAFGGFGFGAMTGGSVHQAPGPRDGQ